MAVAAATLWNIQTDGTSTHGGGFVTGATGTDYSKTIAADLPANNLVTGATSAGAGNVVLTAQASADWVGNIVNCTAGTNFTITGGSSRFECLSVVAGVSATFSTNAAGISICTGIGSGGAFTVGGALKLYNGASDDALLENPAAGNIVYWKSGTHSKGTTNIAAAGTATAYIKWIGYTTTQGDTCNGSDRPIISHAAAMGNAGSYVGYENLIVSCSAAVTSFSISGAGVYLKNCKMINTTSTADSNAFSLSSATTKVYACEFVNPKGYAFLYTANGYVEGCWFHDSKQGLRMSGSSVGTLVNCLFSGNQTAIVTLTAGTFGGILIGNTIYGYSSSTPIGIGIDNQGGAVGQNVLRTIFSGLSVGIQHDVANQLSSKEDYCNFYGNTTDRTNTQIGDNSIALDPGFKGITQRSGATATTAASNSFTQAGATFQTWGITAGTHYIYVVSGTGVTVGVYGITSVDSQTQLTLAQTISADATADKVWYITTGFNWEVGANMKAAGFPGTLPGTSTISYVDIGAVQRKEDYPVVGDSRLGTVYSNGELTGTAAIPIAANVRSGTATDATTGTLSVPTAANVRLGVSVDATTGLAAIPTAANVRSGTATDQTTGTIAVPTASQTLNGVAVDATTGNVVLPTTAQVEDGVAFGPSSSLTGTLEASTITNQFSRISGFGIARRLNGVIR